MRPLDLTHLSKEPPPLWKPAHWNHHCPPPLFIVVIFFLQTTLATPGTQLVSWTTYGYMDQSSLRPAQMRPNNVCDINWNQIRGFQSELESLLITWWKVITEDTLNESVSVRKWMNYYTTNHQGPIMMFTGGFLFVCFLISQPPTTCNCQTRVTEAREHCRE